MSLQRFNNGAARTNETLSRGAATFEWLSQDAHRDTGFSPWGDRPAPFSLSRLQPAFSIGGFIHNTPHT